MLGRRIAARPRPPATVRDLEIALLEDRWSVGDGSTGHFHGRSVPRRKGRQGSAFCLRKVGYLRWILAHPLHPYTFNDDDPQ
ncbi:hypothetical protein TNCV_1314821 [Trichonephila clavipes]|uniref:Uncharacterized protein n=1 Tax=Trichonephila clavipes TaxID=2585209 RepID=A0A8X6SMZ5_TRICX|nr:hypothetical protein TNCV_1314821 [Trichonephila clavipes]